MDNNKETPKRNQQQIVLTLESFHSEHGWIIHAYKKASFFQKLFLNPSQYIASGYGLTRQEAKQRALVQARMKLNPLLSHTEEVVL